MALELVAVEPKESPVITQFLAKQEIKPGPHKIQGIGAGFIPKTLDVSVVDRVEQVNSADSIAFARQRWLLRASQPFPSSLARPSWSCFPTRASAI